MEQTREISALLHLIDDPDEEVFGAVSERIVEYGKPIIPNLEDLWENTPNETIQNRIELIIHKLQFSDLTEDFRQWNVAGHFDLLVGSLLVAKFQYPDLATAPVVYEIEKLRRNVWLELNNYLTPLEQVRIITGILYGYYGLKASDVISNVNYSNINDFFINKVLETKRGNQVSNAIIYLIICELLDIPVKAISIPKQFVLAYLKPGYSSEHTNYVSKIEFYIEPATGQVFAHKDLETYFNTLKVPADNSYFKPLSNKKVIQFLLEELANCFDSDKDLFKKEELLKLAKMLE